MMSKPVHQKMGMKPGERVIFLNGPESAVSAIRFPELIVDQTLTLQFDHIVLFVITQAEMNEQFPKLKPYLKPTGKIWVAWPKAKQLNSDLNVPSVIKIGYDYGLVESTNLSIDPTWTALKFTWPKPGKTYHNSYGKLPDSTS